MASAQTTPRTSTSSLVVTSAWLKDHLRDDALVVLHVGSPASYDSAHIAGAQLAPLSAFDMPRAPGAATPALTLELPPRDTLQATLARYGITSRSRVVVYATNNVPAATRVVLTLQHAGLGANTTLLDGGLAGWIRAGNPVSTERVVAKSAAPMTLDLIPLVVTAEWVREHGSDRGTHIIDARAAGFYDGSQESGPTDARRRGHIPGAANIPYTSLFTAQNELLPTDSLRTLFTNAGVQPGDTVVGYCHIGQQATALLFAARVLGHPVKLYDGSFEDWARRMWPVEAKPE